MNRNKKQERAPRQFSLRGTLVKAPRDELCRLMTEDAWYKVQRRGLIVIIPCSQQVLPAKVKVILWGIEESSEHLWMC